MNYQEALNFIHGRPRFRKKPDLTRMRDFLSRLGHPEQDIQGIHVAGTNGKGSTIAFLNQILLEQGLTVGMFTSPFLERFNERIRINGIPISDQQLIKLVEKIQPIVSAMDQEGQGPLEFEIDTAMMFYYFAQHPVDVVLVEVGIGGKYDSTNVFVPIESVITNVSWDHMQLLGNSIGAIAEQKTGIIKKNRPVISGALEPDAVKVVNQTGNALNSAVFQLNRDFKINSDQNTSTYKDGKRIIRNLKPSLHGIFQKENLALAIKAALKLGEIQKFEITDQVIQTAIQKTRWAGRLELIRTNPPVLIDGAHNLPGIKALTASIQDAWPDKQVIVIAAILEDKNYQAMITELLGMQIDKLILTKFNAPSSRSSVTKDDVSQLLEDSRVSFVTDWQKTFEQYYQAKNNSDKLILITGSLYFISEVRSYLK